MCEDLCLILVYVSLLCLLCTGSPFYFSVSLLVVFACFCCVPHEFYRAIPSTQSDNSIVRNFFWSRIVRGVNKDAGELLTKACAQKQSNTALFALHLLHTKDGYKKKNLFKVLQLKIKVIWNVLGLDKAEGPLRSLGSWIYLRAA